MLDYKKYEAEQEAITHDVKKFEDKTENIYETVALLSKRADQIGLDLKKELLEKIEEFATKQDNLEEIFENREQIELARFYERLPKPTLMAIYEFLNDKMYHRNPIKEESKTGF